MTDDTRSVTHPVFFHVLFSYTRLELLRMSSKPLFLYRVFSEDRKGLCRSIKTDRCLLGYPGFECRRLYSDFTPKLTERDSRPYLLGVSMVPMERLRGRE